MTMIDDLVKEILRLNVEQFLEINKDKINNMFGKNFINSLKEHPFNMKNILVSITSDNKSFIANMVAKIDGYHNIADERLNCFIRLYKLDPEYINAIVDKLDYQTLLNTINYISEDCLNLLPIGNIENRITLLKNERININKIKNEDINDILYYIEDELSSTEYFFKNEILRENYVNSVIIFMDKVLNKLYNNKDLINDIDNRILIISNIYDIIKQLKKLEEQELSIHKRKINYLDKIKNIKHIKDFVKEDREIWGY